MKLVAALFALSAAEGSGDPEVTNCLNSNWELDENGVCQPKVWHKKYKYFYYLGRLLFPELQFGWNGCSNVSRFDSLSN